MSIYFAEKYLFPGLREMKINPPSQEELLGIVSGENHSRYGEKHSIESKKKISKSCQGLKRSEKTKQKMSDSHKGKKLTEETKRKMSLARIGKVNGMLGKKHSDETKRKMSLSTIRYWQSLY